MLRNFPDSIKRWLMPALMTGLCCPSLFADSGVSSTPEEPKPTIVVLYKDDSGHFVTHTSADGVVNLSIEQHLTEKLADIHFTGADGTQSVLTSGINTKHNMLHAPLNSGYPDTLLIGHWNTRSLKPRRSTTESLSRLIIPLGGAALTLGGITSGAGLNYMGTELRTNIGHFLVMASVSNLADEVGDTMAALLENHHAGGVISPEWAAKGAVAVLMLGMGQVKSVADTANLSVGDASRFFAQSILIKNTGLLLGEASGQVLDRIVELSPERRTILTSATGGIMTGGLYYFLREVLTEPFSGTQDLKSKISNATVFSVASSTTPFLQDMVSCFTDNPALKNFSTQAIMTSVALPITGGIYGYLLHSAEPTNRHLQNGRYLLQLVAGSFAKLSGASLASALNRDTIKPLTGESWATPAVMAATYLSLSIAANTVYSAYAGPAGTLRYDGIAKMRDGILSVALASGATAIIEDIIRRAESREDNFSLNINVRPYPTRVKKNPTPHTEL